MHITNLAFTTLLASAAASAIPAKPEINGLNKREETTYDKAGNIKLTFSSETVQIGGLKTDDIIKAVYPICHETGQCETNDIDLKTQLITGSSVTDIQVTIGPDGEYPTWIRNGLLDALGAAARTVAKCTDGTYTNTCNGVSAMAWCPRTQTKFTMCEVPKYWGINYQAANAADAAPPNVGLNIKVEKEGQSDLCKDIMGGLGAVAGAVNGVGGGIFTLLTFACN